MSANRIADVLPWLAGALAWLVATLAVAQSTSISMAVVVPLTLLLGLLVGAVSRVVASDPTRSRSSIVGRACVAVAVGAVVGELAAVVVFSGPIDRVLDERAARSADATPAVAQASAQLGGTRQARVALDAAVDDASRQRDQALVVARCEYHPSPDCPQTHITGVPGAGPETRTATDFLADTKRQLDSAVADRDHVAPGLDARIADGQRVLDQARTTAMKDVDHGFGARWSAMNDYTTANPGAMLLRLITIAFFALLVVLPLILRLWRGQTSEDRGAAARDEVERAELDADTAIAVKRAEVRAAVETMWAEQQLASARLAVEAQMEIDRQEQRRRVIDAIEPPVQAQSERVSEPTLELPAAESDNLPAVVEPERKPGTSLIPSIPDVTKAAARWLRPFVPPIVATAIDNTTKPLRSAREVFEETEEIHFSLRRTHKVSVQSEEHGSVVTEQVEPHSGLREVDGPRQLPAAE
jgi:hypothetical protein